MPYYKGVFFKELPEWAKSNKVKTAEVSAVTSPEPVPEILAPVDLSLPEPAESVDTTPDELDQVDVPPAIESQAETIKEPAASKRRKKKAAEDG